MKAPKGFTNQPSRRVSLWLAPHQEEWVRARAAETFPANSGAGSVIQSPVSRFLRQLVEAEMERETT